MRLRERPAGDLAAGADRVVRDEDHAVVADRHAAGEAQLAPADRLAGAATGREAHDRAARRAAAGRRAVLGDEEAAVRAERQAGDAGEAAREDGGLLAGHHAPDLGAAVRRVRAGELADVQGTVGPHAGPRSAARPSGRRRPATPARRAPAAASCRRRRRPSAACRRWPRRTDRSAARRGRGCWPASKALSPARISRLPGAIAFTRTSRPSSRPQAVGEPAGPRDAAVADHHVHPPADGGDADVVRPRHVDAAARPDGDQTREDPLQPVTLQPRDRTGGPAADALGAPRAAPARLGDEERVVGPEVHPARVVQPALDDDRPGERARRGGRREPTGEQGEDGRDRPRAHAAHPLRDGRAGATSGFAPGRRQSGVDHDGRSDSATARAQRRQPRTTSYSAG